MAGAAQGLAMPGIDYLQAMADGVLPPPPISGLVQGKGYTSVEIKVSYLTSVTTRSGLLTATGTVVKAGARVGFTEGVVTDETGNAVATATSTLLIFDLPAA